MRGIGGLIALLLSGCFSFDLPAGPGDGGQPVDSGARDVGTPVDSGIVPDAALPDAATSPDAGARTDAGGEVVIVDFDDPAPPVASDNPIPGVFEGIDFGTNQWFLTAPYAANTTNSIYFSTDSAMRTFNFDGGARRLLSISTYATSGVAVNLTFTDDNDQTHDYRVEPGGVFVTEPDWPLPSAWVRVQSDQGWSVGLDDIMYR